jgi:hypothetical protein
MAKLKPDVFGLSAEAVHTATITEPKNRQLAITTGAYRVHTVDSNVTSGRAIRQITNIEQLDSFNSTWRNEAAGTNVENWALDPVNPVAFWIYPSVAAGTQLRIHVLISPPDVTLISDVVLDFDVYEPVLVNYVMYRALATDDEAGAVQKSQAYFQLFMEGMK